MKEFRTRAIINAPAEVVWATITNLECYPQFDPTCLKVVGKLSPKNVLKIYSKHHNNRVLKMRVSELKPLEIMVWESRLPFNLFGSVRTFHVIAKDDQTTEFQMIEIFDGRLIKFFSHKIPDLSDSFMQFSKGLKRFIESRP